MSLETDAIFDKVLSLPPGEVIILPFQTKSEMLSKRVIFLREKKKYEEKFSQTPHYKPIFISQYCREKDGIFQLKISTSSSINSWISGAVIQKENGDIIPANLAEQTEETAISSEKERIRSLMLKDGCSEEEINETLNAME